MKGKRFFSSIRVKFSLAFMLLFLAFVLILNTYFLTASRNNIFASNKSFLLNQGTMISSALSALDELTQDGVRQAMNLLDVTDVNRVMVSDSESVLYDSRSDDEIENESVYNENIGNAWAGYDVLYSSFSDGAFVSSSFIPIMSHGTVVGVVYLYEYDTDQGALLIKLQNNLLRFSVFVTVAAILLIAVISGRLMKRINAILDAIKTVRQGEYTYRVPVNGNDEITTLGEEFNSLTNRLQKTEEIRRRFVADASHELKTPLASIRLLSDSILQNEGMDSGTVREFINDIAHESERLARTTEKLLSLTRLDNNRVFEHKRVNVSNVINSALRMLRPLAQERNITISTELEMRCVIYATDDDLYQIIFNLTENAIKYNVDGGKVEIKSFIDDDTVKITVSDTGIGVPDEDLPNIFDRFYRVDKARSREAGGSGLGLSIVRDTVAVHGGSITAWQRSGGGMVFQVSFPCGSNIEMLETS